MFTGYNDNVECSGKRFHVQTEDKGVSNPIVETLVYSGGQVVASVKNSYADLADSPDYSQTQIQRRMQQQHQQLVDEIERGEFKAGKARPRRLSSAGVEHHSSVGLVAEYVDDWIDTAASTEPIRRALELEIDQAGSDALTQPALAGKKKSPLGAAILATVAIVTAGSFLIWFDGRTTQPRSVALPLIPQPVSEPVAQPLPESPVEITIEKLAVVGEDAAPVPNPTASRPAAIDLQPIPPRTRLQERPINAAIPLDPLPESGPQQSRLIDAATIDMLGAIEPPPPIATPVPQPEAERRRDFEASEVDRPPLSRSTQLPVYTETALRRQREGSIRMVVLVGEDGAIDAVRMIDEIDDDKLNRAAVSAVMHWRFEPAMHEGRSVRVWLPIELNFSLSGNGMRSVVTISEE